MQAFDTTSGEVRAGLIGAAVDSARRLVEVDPAFTALAGITPEQALGQALGALFPELDAPLGEVLASGKALRRVPLRHGRATPLPLRLDPILTRRGSVVGVEVLVEPDEPAEAPRLAQGQAQAVGAMSEADEALRQSEARFRVALESAQIVVYTTDRDLRYTWIYNPRLSIGPSQVLGLRDEEMLPPDEAAALTAIKRRVLDTGKRGHGEVALLIGGERHWYELTVEPLRDAAGAVEGLTVVAVDTTARRAAEAALRASEARAAILLEAVPAILYSAAPDGAATYLSQGFYDYTGMPAGNGEGRGWSAVMHPDDQAEVEARWRAAASAGEPFEAEYRFRRFDGAYRWFRTRSRPQRDEHGAIISWFGASLDIDDAKRAEAERETLLAREQAARSRAERTAVQLAQLHDVTLALTQALTPAQAAEVVVARSARALGASSSTVRLLDAAGEALEVLAAIGVPAVVTQRWRSVPLSAPFPIAEVVRSGEALFFRSREELRPWYEALGATVESLGYQAFAIAPLLVEGRAIGSLALTFDEPRAFDVEDRSFILALAGQCAQALERARLYAAAQEAVAARDGFIAVASHDLRTPITTLLGQAQLLERRAASEGLGERGVRSVRGIAQAALRLHRMIDDLLDLSRLQMGQLTIDPAPLLLGPFVRRVVDELQPTLTRHRLLLLGDDLPQRILGDEVRLEQVLHNLIGNAVKYSPEGGQVCVTLEPAGAQVRIHVADQGVGISAEALPHLFERFYRAPDAERRSLNGFGVGLYVVRNVVELHGGSVTVASTEGAGSTFTVTLPAAYS